jgi:hypothetical protein
LSAFDNALVDVDFAVFAFESSWACAGVGVLAISACAAVLARRSCALVKVGFAVLADESRAAEAFVVVFSVDASGLVLARVGCALINVDFAVFAFESSSALASVVVDSIHALTSVFAWLGCALVDVDFAMLAFESSWACALVCVDEIVANTVVEALVEDWGWLIDWKADSWGLCKASVDFEFGMGVGSVSVHVVHVEAFDKVNFIRNSILREGEPSPVELPLRIAISWESNSLVITVAPLPFVFVGLSLFEGTVDIKILVKFVLTLDRPHVDKKIILID